MCIFGEYDGVIIATPTFNHLSSIRRLAASGVPILCEKPISTDIREVLELCRDMEKAKIKLRMVNQYEYMTLDPAAAGFTVYNYWNHGKDGLAFDCINILGLAKGEVNLGETSAVWTCAINGEVMSIADMDHAYIKMIRSWLGGEHENIAYIRHAHRKAEEFGLCRKAS